jgi:hypothetical protein
MSVTSVVRTERLETEYLDSLSQRIRAWRFREGKSYFSMPTPLWDEAVAAARKYGLRSASKMLGLNRDDLKRRMGLLPLTKPEAPSCVTVAETEGEELEVIELPGVAEALASPPVPDRQSIAERPPTTALPTAGEAVIEIVAADGARLTMRLPVAQLDVAALVHGFRSVA